MNMKVIALSVMALTIGCVSDHSDSRISNNSQALHSWSNYHWYKNSNEELQLNLSNNLSSGWTNYLNTTSSDWNQSSVLNTTVIKGSNNPKRCAPTLGRVEVCNSNYGKNGWLGVAQIWLSNGHIYQATVKVNDTYFSTSRYNTVAYKNLVMCQEVGHTFGLDHQDENQTNLNLGTCMDYSNNPAGPPSNEHPNAHDYEELEDIYSHTHSAATASSLTDHDPNEWGQLVRGNQNSQKFVRRFGKDEYLVTHVLLAE